MNELEIKEMFIDQYANFTEEKTDYDFLGYYSYSNKNEYIKISFIFLNGIIYQEIEGKKIEKEYKTIELKELMKLEVLNEELKISQGLKDFIKKEKIRIF